MNKRSRPIPYPRGSEYRRIAIATLREQFGIPHIEAVRIISAENRRARATPLPGEICGAKTRRGTPCRCKAGPSGRCKFHGGRSTGPKSRTGKKKVAKNLRPR